MLPTCRTTTRLTGFEFSGLETLHRWWLQAQHWWHRIGWLGNCRRFARTLFEFLADLSRVILAIVRFQEPLLAATTPLNSLVLHQKQLEQLKQPAQLLNNIHKNQTM